MHETVQGSVPRGAAIILYAIDAGLPSDLADVGASFLLDRRGRLKQLISDSRGKFPRITAWGIEWPIP